MSEILPCPFCGKEGYINYETYEGKKMICCPKGCAQNLELSFWNTRKGYGIKLPERKEEVEDLIKALKPFANITNIPPKSQFTGGDVNNAEQVLRRIGAI